MSVSTLPSVQRLPVSARFPAGERRITVVSAETVSVLGAAETQVGPRRWDEHPGQVGPGALASSPPWKGHVAFLRPPAGDAKEPVGTVIGDRHDGVAGADDVGTADAAVPATWELERSHLDSPFRSRSPDPSGAYRVIIDRTGAAL